MNETVVWFEELRQQGKFKAASIRRGRPFRVTKGQMSGRFALRPVRELQVYLQCSAKKYAARPWTPTYGRGQKLGLSWAAPQRTGTEILFTQPMSDNESGSAKLHSHCGAANSQVLLLVRIACRSYR